MNTLQIGSSPMRGLLLSLMLLAATGCSEAIPEKADPSQARAAVVSALDAWKRGEQPSQLNSATPAIQVADEDWLVGFKLESYQLGPADTHRGLGLQCPVILSLKARNGKRMTKKVTYNVGTEPILSVIRQESN